ncbi:hypothetical protein JI435_021300 [Parastagonospora nodorum SN15]|uniref:Methylated-DNA-[protein]-cysteine S-methyltransferase DNA binding domain-containing protein n=1 Tax=Phaeosphaeria nodorum (strain SN15 / ATCC MYA-4574 / FGSC 10173) TaxID=321614 RepID=A0A7U2ES28_PHANO|nr:hypothetical protein JI435_021300 [Parastagonospora nodorum SN15]
MAPGERSEEVHLWYTAVFEACQEIPRGNYLLLCISRCTELTAEQARSRATGTSRDSSGSVSDLLHHQDSLLTHLATNQLNVPVGVCLKHLPSPSTDSSKKSATFHSGNVPWQRVLNAKGSISPRGPGAAARQADALRREGVEVREDAMGQYAIDLAKYGWFPDTLPSESGQVESSDEEDEEAAAYHT